MDLILLLLILAVFILPSFFMMRTQRKRQSELQNMQNSLQVGDRVVTVSGMHGTITGERGTEIDIELAPGVEVVMDRIAVLRPATPAGVDAAPDTAVTPGYEQSGYDQIPGDTAAPTYDQTFDEGRGHPENFPDNHPDAGIDGPETPRHPEDNR